jgi:Clp amino terminal domain, pathogenicity island component
MPRGSLMVDPVTIKVASSIAGRLAGPTVKPVGKKLRDVVLGPPEQTATEQIIRTAIGRAVDEVRDQGLDQEMVRHVLLMFEHLFMRQYRDNADAITQANNEVALLYWRQAAEAAGWDLATFPLHFPQVVERILEHLRVVLREEAGKPESPLFNRMTVTALTELEARVAAVLETSATALARAVPLAEPLRRTLDGALHTARATDRAFFTPHLLLALLRQPDSLTGEIFNHTQRGLAKKIEDRLSAYLAGTPLGRFADFDWRERGDVRAAQVAAVRQGSPVVTEAHLLIGILETPSNTRRQLVAWLGPELAGKAKEAALRLQSAAARTGTPGVVFPASQPGA